MATPTVKAPPVLPTTGLGQNTQFVGGQAPQINAAAVGAVNAPSTPQVGLNERVLQAGQEKVLGGFQSPVLQQTSDLTQRLMQDPNLGVDYTKQQAGKMGQFDFDRSQAVESVRRSLAPVWHTGQGAEQFLDVALQGGRERSALQRQLEEEAVTKQRENYLQALTEGRATGEQERLGFQTDVGALVDVRGMAEPEAQRVWQGGQNAIDRGMEIALTNNNSALQGYLTELQGKVDQGLQLTAQDFEASQAELNRILQTSLQANDINAVRENIGTQLAFDRWKTEAGFEFTGEQNALNRALESTLQTNDIAANSALVELKGKVDAGLLTQGNEWKTVENALDRAAAVALQTGDIAGQVQIETLRGEIQAQAQAADQIWKSSERIASQGWATGERLSEQDFATTTKYLDQRHDLAMQENDQAHVKYIENQRNMVALKMQTNDMAHDEKMAYIFDQLATARADGDVERQQTLMTFQEGIELRRIYTEFGYDRALQESQQTFETALQNGDFEHAEVMLKLQQDFIADEAAKDRALESARVKLSEFGINMEAIQAQVDAGTLAPDAAIQLLQTQLFNSGAGVGELTPLDYTDTVHRALDAEYDSQRYQWKQTHPEGTDEEFMQYFNETMYGDEGVQATVGKLIDGIESNSTLRGGADPEADNHDVFAEAFSTAAPLSGAYLEKTGENVIKFRAAPEVGQYFTDPQNPDRLFYVTSGVVRHERWSFWNPQVDNESFQAIDVNTGDMLEFFSSNYD
ncbi:MAG: hypothetical protein ABIH23_15555 [bacterium]